MQKTQLVINFLIIEHIFRALKHTLYLNYIGTTIVYIQGKSTGTLSDCQVRMGHYPIVRYVRMGQGHYPIVRYVWDIIRLSGTYGTLSDCQLRMGQGHYPIVRSVIRTVNSIYSER